MTDVIQAEGLTKRFREVTAVDGVSFTIEAGTITGLLGRNGAGKTTLMGLITAQGFPTAGSVRVFGEDPMENDRVLSQLCFIRENQRYPNNVKVRHVLDAGRHFYPAWDVDLAQYLVDQFDLPRNRQVQKLSRGMTSAVGIVVGLASRAPVTIFDEPYLGLDATARQLFYDQLLTDIMEHPRTVVLSTHLIDEVSNLLDNVLVIEAGRLVVDAPAEELRGSATTLVGRTDRVELLARDFTVLHREHLGSLGSVTVQGRLDDATRRQAADLSVELVPVSLQQLVVRAGSKPATSSTTHRQTDAITHTTTGASR